MKNGARRKLTDITVQNLKAGPKRYIEWEPHGLGVRVTPQGVKSFVFVYRFEGRLRMMTLRNKVDKTTYPAITLAEAREAHREAQDKLNKGTDPAAKAITEREAEHQAHTVVDLAREYVEKWAKPRKRSWKTDKRILEKDVLPDPPDGAGWGRRKAKDITKREVIRLLDTILERGAPIMANRTLAVIRRMFNFAMERDIISASPCMSVKAPASENQRDRVLSIEEIRAFWHGLDGENMNGVSPYIKLALKLELVTAQRKNECCAAAWEEIDMEEGWWTIPGEKTELRLHHGVEEGLAKNKLPHRVPLTALAIEILRAAKALSGDSPWVFPSHRTSRPITPPAINHALRLRRESLGIAFIPHDLRRTAASQIASIGFGAVVDKILNHKDNRVTAVYDRHSYDREKRQALEAWGRKLKTIISGTEGKDKVIPLVRGA